LTSILVTEAVAAAVSTASISLILYYTAKRSRWQALKYQHLEAPTILIEHH